MHALQTYSIRSVALALLCSLLFFFALPFLSGSESLLHAQGVQIGSTGGSSSGQGWLLNPLNPQYSSITGVIIQVLKTVVQIAFPIAILFIVYSGFLFVKAQGNEEELKHAKQTFLWTVIGIAIFLGSWLLATIIDETIKAIT